MSNDEELTRLAEKAKAEGDNDLAIVLYTYLGSKKIDPRMGSEFARYCQAFAKEGAKTIELYLNRGNN